MWDVIDLHKVSLKLICSAAGAVYSVVPVPCILNALLDLDKKLGKSAKKSISLSSRFVDLRNTGFLATLKQFFFYIYIII